MPIDYSEQSERLRIRMTRLRHTLDRDVEEAVDRASDLLDWRYYLQNFPLTSVGVLALAAYHLVPKRTVQQVKISDSAIREVLESSDRLVAPEPKEKPSFTRSMLEIGAQAMLRTALTFATRKLIADTLYASPAQMEREESAVVRNS